MKKKRKRTASEPIETKEVSSVRKFARKLANLMTKYPKEACETYEKCGTNCAQFAAAMFLHTTTIVEDCSCEFWKYIIGKLRNGIFRGSERFIGKMNEKTKKENIMYLVYMEDIKNSDIFHFFIWEVREEGQIYLYNSWRNLFSNEYFSEL